MGPEKWADAVEVDLGGDRGRVKFFLGVNEMLRLSAALGIKEGEDDRFFAVLDELTGSAPSIQRLRLLFFHALTRFQPDATEELAGDVMTLVGLDALSDLLGRLLSWALPDEDKSGSDAGGAPRPSGGPTSSPTRPGRGSRRPK